MYLSGLQEVLGEFGFEAAIGRIVVGFVDAHVLASDEAVWRVVGVFVICSRTQSLCSFVVGVSDVWRYGDGFAFADILACIPDS